MVTETLFFFVWPASKDCRTNAFVDADGRSIKVGPAGIEPAVPAVFRKDAFGGLACKSGILPFDYGPIFPWVLTNCCSHKDLKVRKSYVCREKPLGGHGMLHKVVWLKVGGKRLHLLKVAGAFFVFAAVLKLAQSLYDVFVTVEKARAALLRPELVPQLFGWSIDSNALVYSFSYEDFLGVMLGPVAVFLFWFGMAVVALMIYNAGKIIVPLEEYDSQVAEHHRSLIQKAVEHHKKKK